MSNDSNEYPRRWDWNDDGTLADGTFVRWDVGIYTSQEGHREECPLLILEIDEELRGFWLFYETLRDRLRTECRRRPSRTLDPGERLSLSRLPRPKEPNRNGRRPYGWHTWFENGVEPTADEILSIGGQPEVEASPVRVEAPNDGSGQAGEPADAGKGPGDEIPF